MEQKDVIIPSGSWINDEAYSIESVIRNGAMEALSSSISALEAMNPEAKPGFNGDIPVDSSRNIHFPGNTVPTFATFGGVDANLDNTLVTGAAADLLVTFDSGHQFIVSQGSDYYWSGTMTAGVAAVTLTGTSVDSVGGDIFTMYNANDGTPLVGYVLGIGESVRFVVKMSPYLGVATVSMAAKITISSGVASTLRFNSTSVASYPNELTVQASTLIHVVNSGGYQPLFVPLDTDLSWGELFLTEQKPIWIDKDVSLAGYVSTLVDEQKWDASMELLRCVSKKTTIPEDFTAITGLPETTQGWEQFIDHFREHGIAGMLFSSRTQPDGFPIASSLPFNGEDNAVRVYEILLTALANICFVLQARAPKGLSAALDKCLRIC
jgi:hypothetical protein